MHGLWARSTTSTRGVRHCNAHLCAYLLTIAIFTSLLCRRTRSENVCVIFNNEVEGETRGMFIADPDEYGADKLWCLLKPIPLVISDTESETVGEAAAAAQGATGSGSSS